MHIQILQESFQIIALDGNAFSAAFYAQLFETYPQLRRLFDQTSIETQQQKFLMMIILIIEQLHTPEILESALKKLGQRHETYKVVADHYPMVGNVLIDVLAQFCGQHWNSEWETAWRDAYDIIVGVMQNKHSLMPS